MTDVQTTSAPPPKRPRGGKGTWKRYYCDPAVSPKHAKGRVGGSPRTSPLRTPRSQDLAFSVVKEIAAILAPYPRHGEPPHVVVDVLLRVLPLPDCARATIALVVHRKSTGSCDNLTYRKAGALGGCDRRTAINRFARTESYGFIRVEQRDHEWGGPAPNLVTTTIPSWVYEQVDDYLAIPAILRPPEKAAASAPVGAGRVPLLVASRPPVETTEARPAAPAEAAMLPGTGPDAVAATVASPSSTVAAAPAASDVAVAEGAVRTETSPPAPALSPEDAAIDTRLVQIHAITGERFEVAAVRGLNAQVPTFIRDADKPQLDDEQILDALDEYIKKELPHFERQARYRKRGRDRDWVKNGIHAYLWGMRKRLTGQAARKDARAEQHRRGPAARRRPQASVPATGAAALAAAAAPVQLGATFERGTTIVRSVDAGSLAARLLLQPGDKLLRVDDQAVASTGDLRAMLSTMEPGPHTFALVRSNEVVTVTVTVEPRGPPSA